MATWSGSKDSGSPIYRPDEYATVTTWMLARCVGPERACSVEQIATATGLGSRTVRAILSAADSTADMGVVAYTEDNGCFLATYAEQAEGYTRKLGAQIATMQHRQDRRHAATQRLPRGQLRLWDAPNGPPPAPIPGETATEWYRREYGLDDGATHDG
jgi:hypothetical protein